MEAGSKAIMYASTGNTSASPASLAGLLKLRRQGMSFSGKTIVCVVTGSGLKDPDTALKSPRSILELPADLKAVEQALGWA